MKYNQFSLEKELKKACKRKKYDIFLKDDEIKKHYQMIKNTSYPNFKYEADIIKYISKIPANEIVFILNNMDFTQNFISNLLQKKETFALIWKIKKLDKDSEILIYKKYIKNFSQKVKQRKINVNQLFPKIEYPLLFLRHVLHSCPELLNIMTNKKDYNLFYSLGSNHVNFQHIIPIADESFSEQICLTHPLVLMYIDQYTDNHVKAIIQKFGKIIDEGMDNMIEYIKKNSELKSSYHFSIPGIINKMIYDSNLSWNALKLLEENRFCRKYFQKEITNHPNYKGSAQYIMDKIYNA